MPSAKPRRFWGIVSAMMPPPLVRHTEEKAPWKRRKTMTMLRSVAKAMAMVKRRKPTLPTCWMTRRPYSSESGAKMTGPVVMPSRKMVMTKEPSVWLVELNSWRTAGMAGANIEELSPAMKDMKLARVIMVQRHQEGQF
jgi:hypothetical protein